MTVVGTSLTRIVSPDDRRIGAEAALEEIPAEQNRRRAHRRAVIAVVERAPERGLGAEHAERSSS